MQLSQFHNNLYVLSAYVNDESGHYNDQRHKALGYNLKRQGISVSECEGRYKGKKEKSWIIIGSHKIVAHHYASIYFQECFLRLEPHKDNMYKAYAVDVETGDESFAGYFRSFSESVVTQLDLDYTKDSNGTYFSIWHSDNSDLAEFMSEIGQQLIERKRG